MANVGKSAAALPKLSFGFDRLFESLISDAELFADGCDSIGASSPVDTLLLSSLLISGCSDPIERVRGRSTRCRGATRGFGVVLRVVVVERLVVTVVMMVLPAVSALRALAVTAVGRRRRLSTVVASVSLSSMDGVVVASLLVSGASVVSSNSTSNMPAVVVSLGATVVVWKFMRLLVELPDVVRRGTFVRFDGLGLVVLATVVVLLIFPVEVVSSSSEDSLVTSVLGGALVVDRVFRGAFEVVVMSAARVDSGGGASPNTLLTLLTPLSVLTLLLCRAPNKNKREELFQLAI